ncbi:MAG: hypothetical protein AAGD14_14835, partial [Planctomycetota bacterium]
MKRHWYIMAFVSSLLLAGCGGGGGGYGGSPTPTSLTGTLQIPSSPIAQSIGGLVAVPNATVELIRIDADGNPVGEVLASAVTDANGGYTIELPEGVTLGPDLIVRVTGGPANGLRALAIERDTNIDPSTEYLLRELTSDGNSLADVTAREIQTLADLLEDYPIPGGETIENAIDDLDDRAGEALEPLVDVVVQDEGDTDTISGNYHFIQFGVTVESGAASGHFADRGSLTIESGAEGAGRIADINVNEFGLSLFASPDGGGASYSLFNDDENVSDDPSIPFQFPADGTLVVLEPSETEIDEESGSRSESAAHMLYPAGEAFIGALGYGETHYGLTETDQLDLEEMRGRTLEHSLFVTAPQTPLSNNTLNNKTFGYITIGELYESNGTRELFADLGIMVFDRRSNTTGEVFVTDDIVSLFRTPGPETLNVAVAWGNTGEGGVDDVEGEDDGSETRDYVLNPATGAVSMTQEGGGEDFDGFFANNGKLLFVRETFISGDAENSIAVAVRLGESIPTTDGSYKVIGMQKSYGTDGATRTARFPGTSLTINGTNVSLTIGEQVHEKGDDLDVEVDA